VGNNKLLLAGRKSAKKMAMFKEEDSSKRYSINQEDGHSI
jgi:hypothetical protein